MRVLVRVAAVLLIAVPVLVVLVVVFALAARRASPPVEAAESASPGSLEPRPRPAGAGMNHRVRSPLVAQPAIPADDYPAASGPFNSL
jgi:hypothetical protein